MGSTDLSVRRATPADAPAIRTIAAASWHAAHGDILGRETVDEAIEEWYDVDGLRDAIARDDGHFLVADDGDLVGFAQAGRSDGAPADAVLSRIYAHPERWGEGIGTALLDGVITLLTGDGHDDLWIAVLADNDVGVRFYRARGFDVRERRTVELFGVETTELVMVSELPDNG